MSKIIMHIDLNAFFATAEVIRNPALAGKPILIGHAGRSGIVSTASYEARRYGCHSGQPTFQALQKCPQAIIVPPDFDYYQVMSNSFFAYVSKFSPIIERASIDEGYVDMTKALANEKDPVAYLKGLQDGLKKETGLMCSIGIAPTKFLAKMASDMKKPMGLVFLRRKDIPALLYPLPIESFWGIGKKTSPRLREIGISTIGDLAKKANAEDEQLKNELGKFFYVIKDWVNGYGSDVVEVTYADPKSIGNSETLMADSSTLEEVSSVITRLSKEVSSRAKRENKEGYSVVLTVKDTEFHLHSKTSTLNNSTNDADEIEKRVKELYKENYQGLLVRLVGVTLGRLANPSRETIQMSLWNYEQYEAKDQTKLLIDELNRKLKKPALFRGSQINKKDH